MRDGVLAQQSRIEKRKRAAAAANERTEEMKKVKVKNVKKDSSTGDAMNDKLWECNACTFMNENLIGLACEICGTERSNINF